MDKQEIQKLIEKAIRLKTETNYVEFKYAQASRNEIIAARLKELDYLEEYGRGIDIVFNEMKKWDLLPPIFKNTSNSFKVILMGE